MATLRSRTAIQILVLLGVLLPIGPTFAQSIEYIHTDALGTPVAVTDADRNVLQVSEYEPFGKVLNRPVTDGPGYTGHVSDAATGLSYMQQRYYDPQIGRFLSVDPVTADGNSGGNFNRYWYANNNPYKFTDPDGREVEIKGADAYVKQVTAQIANGKKIEPGFRDRMKQLEDSKFKHIIQNAAGDKDGPLNKNFTDSANQDDDSNGVGSGTTTLYDPNNGVNKNGEARPPEAGLAHEISHAAEKDAGKIDRTVNPETKEQKTESNAAIAGGQMMQAIEHQKEDHSDEK